MLVIVNGIDANRKHVAHSIASRNGPVLQSEIKVQQQVGADYIGIEFARNTILSGSSLTWLLECMQQTSNCSYAYYYYTKEVIIETQM